MIFSALIQLFKLHPYSLSNEVQPHGQPDKADPTWQRHCFNRNWAWKRARLEL